MRVGYTVLVAAAAVLASIGSVSAVVEVDQTQISKVASANNVRSIGVAPTDVKRFLRRKKTTTNEGTADEERGIEEVASKIDDLLPYIRQVNKKSIDSAIHLLRYQGLSFERIEHITNYLKLSAEDRKKALLLLANK
ncbi:Unconventional myosin-XVI [Phytophthora ramorum]